MPLVVFRNESSMLRLRQQVRHSSDKTALPVMLEVLFVPMVQSSY